VTPRELRSYAGWSRAAHLRRQRHGRGRGTCGSWTGLRPGRSRSRPLQIVRARHALARVHPSRVSTSTTGMACARSLYRGDPCARFRKERRSIKTFRPLGGNQQGGARWIGSRCLLLAEVRRHVGQWPTLVADRASVTTVYAIRRSSDRWQTSTRGLPCAGDHGRSTAGPTLRIEVATSCESHELAWAAPGNCCRAGVTRSAGKFCWVYSCDQFVARVPVGEHA
jgi:hypothetical protein